MCVYRRVFYERLHFARWKEPSSFASAKSGLYNQTATDPNPNATVPTSVLLRQDAHRLQTLQLQHTATHCNSAKSRYGTPTITNPHCVFSLMNSTSRKRDESSYRPRRSAARAASGGTRNPSLRRCHRTCARGCV